MTPEEIIAATADKVLPQLWPIWEGGDRVALSRSIIRHYYIYEIGLETVGLWRFYIGMRLNERMPYYIDLVKSKLEYDKIFDTQDKTIVRRRDEEEDKSLLYNKNHTVTENQTKESDMSGTRTSDSSSTQNLSGHEDQSSSNTQKYSDTPQDGLQNVIDGTYLTNVTIDSGSGDSNTTSDSSSTQDYDEEVSSNTTEREGRETGETEDYGETSDRTLGVDVRETYAGFEGNRVEFTMQYREAIINVTEMIIHDLRDLFISIL